MSASYRRFLSAPGARRILAAAIFARMPLGMSGLAILLLVRERTGSFAVAGAALGAYSLASGAVSPLQGALVDRFGQPRVLLPSAAAQTSLFVALVVFSHRGAGSALLIALVAPAGALIPPVSACARALWSQLAPDEAALEAAYAIDAITQEVIWISGPLLVALMVSVASPAAAVLLSAGITISGAAFFASAPLVRRWHRGPHRRSRAGALASPALRVLLGSSVLTGFSWGAVSVGLPAMGVHAGSHRSPGVLLALLGTGSMLGGLCYGALRWQTSPGTRYRGLFALLALCTAPLIVVHSLPAGYALSLLAGLCWAPLLSCQYALVGKAAPAGTVTEAFTWMTGAVVGGVAGGSALAGTLAERVGVGAPFALVCGAACLAAAVATAGRRRIEPAGLAPATAT